MRTGLTRRVRRANGLTGQQLAGGNTWTRTRNLAAGRLGSRDCTRATAAVRVARSQRVAGRARRRTRAAASSPHPARQHGSNDEPAEEERAGDVCRGHGEDRDGDDGADEQGRGVGQRLASGMSVHGLGPSVSTGVTPRGAFGCVWGIWVQCSPETQAPAGVIHTGSVGPGGPGRRCGWMRTPRTDRASAGEERT
jgi:hypothetical protein